MARIEGFCNEPFGRMADVLAASIDAGNDVGASVAVTVDGELVADIWGGWVDAERTTAWQRDTVVNVFSTTKTMTSLSALVLADRGELDLDAPVAQYWPEFAANGKDSILVKQIMSHTSGVSAWDPPVVMEDVYDWDKSTSILAAQAPWWEPGSASGYHMLNHGHLVGEVVRRISGRGLRQFFADEIAGPLHADFHIGLDSKHDERVAPVIAPPPLVFDLDAMDRESPAYKSFISPLCLDEKQTVRDANSEPWRRADIGAANGHGNARSVARIQAVVANGGTIDGVTLLSPATIDRIFEVQSDGIDLVLGIPLTWGIGYALPRPDTFPYLPTDSRICFWGGFGGSMIIIDLDRRMTIAYMMNQLGEGIIGGPRSTALIEAAYAAV